MATTSRETWTFTMQLPAGIGHGGRFVARILKHLLRTWGVKCVAVIAAPPEAAPPAATALGPAFGVKVARAQVEEIEARLAEESLTTDTKQEENG
jgi:hypothetical protein